MSEQLPIANQYTQELIELAVQQMLSPDVSVQQAAADFIESWKHSDDAYILAFAILTHSVHVYAQFYAMLVIKESVARKWDQLPDTFRDSLRNYLYQSLSVFAAGSPIFSSACDVISLIGVFDWPDRWPTFVKDILSDSLTPLIQLSLLDRFTSTITDGIYVTHTRRAKLLGVILELSPQINQCVNAALSEVESMSIAFSVLDTQLKTEALTLLLREGIIGKLIELLPLENAHNGAIQCLNTIFIDRYDCFKLAPTYLPQILRAFSVLLCETSFSTTALLLLVEKILLKHSSLICYLLSGMESKIDIEGAFKDAKIDDLGQTQIDILFLLQIILSNRPDEKQIDAYWALWRCLLPHLFTPPLSELPISEQTRKLLPLIHESLFNVLPLAGAEHTMIDTVARICWGTDAALFPEDISEFLKAQKPSVALAYAIGFAEKTLPDELLTSIFQVQLDPLLEYFKTPEGQDQDYAIALLFCLSHGGQPQIENPQFFNIFIELAMGCLEHRDETVTSEATRALHYVARKNYALYMQNGMELAFSMCGKIQMFLENLSQETATGIVRLSAFLAEKSQRDELYPNIIQPIYQMFMTFVENLMESVSSNSSSGTSSGGGSPLSQNGTNSGHTSPTNGNSTLDRDVADFILTLISDIAPSFPSQQLLLFEEPMFSALTTAGSSHSFNLNTLELFVRAAASIVARRPPGEALEPLTQLYSTLSGNYEKNYLLFDSVAMVRSIHPEVDSFFAKIEQDFIIPLVAGEIELDDCTSLFRMISFFSLAVFDISVLTNLLVFGLRHTMSIVTIAAVKCARRVLHSFDPPPGSNINLSSTSSASSTSSLINISTAPALQIPTTIQAEPEPVVVQPETQFDLGNFTNSLIPPIVVSLTDGIHSTAVGPLVHILYDLFTRNEEIDPSCQDLAALFLQSLQTYCQEPHEGVFLKFTDMLIQCRNDQRSFRHVVFDLLVTLRCATPCDLTTFDAVVGPVIWVPDDFSTLMERVITQIRKQQEDENSIPPENQDISMFD